MREDETKCQLGKQFRWWFSSRQQISFRCRFPSQLGLCALTNTDVSYKRSLVDYVWVVSYTVFGDDYRVKKDYARRQNQVSAGEAVSVTIFESAANRFRCRIPSHLGLCTDQSRRQLWRQSRWLFLSRQVLRFRWRLMSQQGLCARTTPGLICVGSLVDYFWGIRYSVFGDHYRVKRDCARRWNQVSVGEAVSVMIFESAANQFSVSISESTGTVCVDQYRRQL